MNAIDFVAMAEFKLGEAFPNLVVRLSPDPDDDTTFFAYMFCVPDGDERDTKIRARAFIAKYFVDYHEWRVIPSIKSLSVTKEHYPQYLKTEPIEEIIPNAKIFLFLDCSQQKLTSARPYFIEDLALDNDICTCIPEIIPKAQHGSFSKLAA